jgi:uncharacterized protein (TIGR03086 family)
MTTHAHELPVFPTSAPEIFRDPDAARPLFSYVLGRLAEVVDVHDDQLDLPTPCADYTVRDLRTHVLGWLDFFATALADPAALEPRPDPQAFTIPAGVTVATVVLRCREGFDRAISGGLADELVVMSSSRMAGDGVLAMALGEYIVHGWDLAVATARPYDAPDAAVVPALDFLHGMVAPEYRGADSGFFDAEVPVPAEAPPLHRLLGFAGRDLGWRA